jgi:hypothetical protein
MEATCDAKDDTQNRIEFTRQQEATIKRMCNTTLEAVCFILKKSRLFTINTRV